MKQVQNDDNVKITEKKNRKIKTRVILVLVFIAIVGLIAYMSYRGNYLETIEIGENFKQVS